MPILYEFHTLGYGKLGHHIHISITLDTEGNNLTQSHFLFQLHEYLVPNKHCYNLTCNTVEQLIYTVKHHKSGIYILYTSSCHGENQYFTDRLHR